MKIITVIGARPQFIKAAAVSRALLETDNHETIIHTGQHFDNNMSDVFFSELDIPTPTYNLGIGGGTHGQNTGRMIEAIEQTLLTEQPEWVLVYGDTDSTLAATLAAVKLHIPVAHVEAGLRSFNKQMPEEHNRILSDHAASLLFAPTETAVAHLANEGLHAPLVQLVGDVMYDATLFYGEKAEKESRVLEKLGLQPKSYILATIHRAENTTDHARLIAIIEGFGLSGQPIILPLHPRTAKIIGALDIKLPSNVTTTDPVGYLDMLILEKYSRLIATDSGGVQKEAFFQRVPCVTLRDETEWVELIDAGWNRLAPPENGSSAIAESIGRALDTSGENINPYGDANASTHIATFLSAHNLS